MSRALAAVTAGEMSSALSPAGSEAARTAELFWTLLAVGGAIWLITLGLAFWALRARGSVSGAQRLIVLGGFAAPALILAVLLWRGLSDLRDRGAAASLPPDLRLRVTGERFWWRVQYLDEEARDTAAVLANEIRLPLDRVAELELHSPDVIHSLWIPSLAGKLDLLPGRRTQLRLHPLRRGRFAGVCAEYCGLGHTQMRLSVTVLPEPEFEQWRAHQTQPATMHAPRGAAVFADYGCGACHAVRGTEAAGRIGPDLTHLGSRPHLAAGALPMEADSLRRWIRAPEQIKPGALMPAFPMIPDQELDALVEWLVQLE